MPNLLDTEIAQHIAETLYEEVSVDQCLQCTLYEETGNMGICSLAIFEESLCPPVKAKLIQIRESIDTLIPADITGV